jgi:putative tryptophan/tyrosine transport system permease protein
MQFYIAAIIQGLGYASMALGIFVSLRIYKIPDITTDGSYTLGGALTAILLMSGFHPFTAFVVAISGGALAGMSSGLIHTRLNVNPLLAGILVMTALYSVNLSIMGQSNIPLVEVPTLFELSSFSMTPFLTRFIWMFFVTLVAGAALIWLLKTDYGIAMRATGSNDQMVRAMGMNTNMLKVAGLALANALTAFSGFLMVQYQGFADINMGIGIVISGLAAVMIGEAIARMFRSNSIIVQVLLVIAGSILFRLILAFTLSLGLNPNYLKLITALIVLAVLAATNIKKSTR